MSNNKQSRVEWLIDQICGDHTGAWEEQIKQAKAMHKDEIIDAITFGQNNHTVSITDDLQKLNNTTTKNLNQNKMTAELIDHNISTFLRRTGEMPNGIILHPKSVEILVDNYKEAFGNINIMNVYLTPIKYRGITIYESLGLNENEIKLTY